MSVETSAPVRPQQHSRSKSTFSFRSTHSDKSSKQKVDLRESANEKARRHLSSATKANPNAAISEAQPIAAAFENNTIAALRSVQHKDENGTVIEEPDLSNPTRHRWERPLDTIRSFEASIDGVHKRKSMLGGGEFSPGQRYSMVSRPGSYYGNEIPSFGRRQSHLPPPRGSFRDLNDSTLVGPPPPMPGQGPRRPRQNPRYQSEPNFPNRYHGNGYGPPPPMPHRIPEPVDSGSNGSPSEPWGSSTDPSSENSSIERNKADLAEQYGMNNFAGLSNSGDLGLQNGYINNNSNNNSYGRARPRLNGEGGAAYHSTAQVPQQSSLSHTSQPQIPAAPVDKNGQRKIIRLSSNQSGQSGTGKAVNAVEDKRKSWLKRRFSKA